MTRTPGWVSVRDTVNVNREVERLAQAVVPRPTVHPQVRATVMALTGSSLKGVTVLSWTKVQIDTEALALTRAARRALALRDEA